MSIWNTVKTWNARRKQAGKATYVEAGASPRISSDSSSTLSDKIMSMMRGYSGMPTPYPRDILNGLDGLFTYHPYFRNYLTTMVALTNTGHSLEISASTEARAKEALEVSNNYAARCFPLSAGYDGAVNGMISQATRFGAVCAESPPDELISELTQIYLVPVRTIEFTKDADGNLVCCQRQDGKLVELNMVQTVWSVALPWDGSPYPVPPALAALQATAKLKHFDESLDGWLKKLSALGVFIGTIANPPRDYEKQESDAQYQERSFQILKRKAEAAREALDGGFVVGFENEKYTFQNTTAGAAGAQQLREMVCTSLFAGLGMDPTFFGHASKTPDTFAKVLFEVLIGRCLNIQNVVKRASEHFHRLNLALNGLGDCAVSVVFERNRSLDAFLNNEAEIMGATRFQKDFELQIASLEEARARLGYEDESAKSGAFVASFNKRANRYDMLPMKREQWTGADLADGRGAGRTRNNRPRSRNTLMNSKRDAIKAARDYRAEVTQMLSDAGAAGVQGVYEWALAHDVPDVDEFVALALERFSSSAEGTIDEKKLIELAREHLTTIWEYGLTDKALFGGDSSLGVGISFGEADKTAVAYLAEKVDRFYVSKYVSQSDPRSKQIQNFLREQYLEKGLGRGASKPELQAFKDEFGDLVEGIGDHAARVIIDTGVSRAQNWANIMALHQSEITEFSIAGPRDSHTCQYCWSMLDRTFSVETEHTRIQEIIDSGDEDISKFHKFITSRYGTNAGLESLRAASDADVQASGMVVPPIHPQCRHRLIAKVTLTSSDSNRRVMIYAPTVAFQWRQGA